MLLNGITEYFKDVHSLQIQLQVYCNSESKYTYFQLDKMVPEFMQNKQMKIAVIFAEKKKNLLNGDCPTPY